MNLLRDTTAPPAKLCPFLWKAPWAAQKVPKSPIFFAQTRPAQKFPTFFLFYHSIPLHNLQDFVKKSKQTNIQYPMVLAFTFATQKFTLRKNEYCIIGEHSRNRGYKIGFPPLMNTS